MKRIDYKSSIVVFIIVAIALNAINIKDINIDSIRNLLLNLVFITGYLFCYLGWKNRILLVNYFWTVFYVNIEFINNNLIGLHSINEETKILLNKIALVFNAIGLVFLILGISKRKYKYLSDNIDYSIKTIIWISIIATILFQGIIRIVFL